MDDPYGYGQYGLGVSFWDEADATEESETEEESPDVADHVFVDPQEEEARGPEPDLRNIMRRNIAVDPQGSTRDSHNPEIPTTAQPRLCCRCESPIGEVEGVIS